MLKRYRGNECQSIAPDALWCRSDEVAEYEERMERQLSAALIVIREGMSITTLDKVEKEPSNG